MTDFTYEDIRYKTDGHVAIITIDRPEVRNALSMRSYDELERAVRTTAARCLVITGTDPAFCAGDDVKQVMLEKGAELAEQLRAEPKLTATAEALLHTDIPVIAAINGPALGWGMELALMADIRVASERARLGELFVKRGLCCDVPGLGRLAHIAGREVAAELLFTGRIVDAASAKELRLVSRVVPHDDLLPAALELAHEIAANPPLAVKRLKAGLREAVDPDWVELGRWVGSALGELFETEDHKEGVRSFLEKRPPAFVGR